jgi:5,10-methylenetetrahydrofolate reductase
MVTPPVLDVAAFLPVLDRLRTLGLPVIAGVAALEGLRHAEFLASEISGVRVSEELLSRLMRADNQTGEAVAITNEIVSLLRPAVHGFQITSFRGSTAAVERLLGELGSVASAGTGRGVERE